MSKKKIIILVILFLIIGTGSFFYFKAQQKSDLISPTTMESKITASTSPVIKTYKDEAGFSFNYSGDLQIEEVKNQDENTYSALEIFLASNPQEKIRIQVVDTDFSNAEEWLLKNKKTGWVVEQAKISGMEGKIIRLPDKMISLAIKDGILFKIESPIDSRGFWEREHKTILESFLVQWPEERYQTGGSQNIELEEEIIE